MFALVADRAQTLAINGAGATPQAATTFADDGPHSVTVPGLAGGWAKLHRRWGRLPAATVLAPAIRLAQDGHRVSPTLVAAVTAQRTRLLAHGAAAWSLLSLAAGDRLVQPELAACCAASPTMDSMRSTPARLLRRLPTPWRARAARWTGATSRAMSPMSARRSPWLMPGAPWRYSPRPPRACWAWRSRAWPRRPRPTMPGPITPPWN
jgi:hypothetical protein